MQNDAETNYSASPTPDTYATWRHKARALDLVLLKRVQSCTIYRIKNSSGAVVEHNKDIVEAFDMFYSTLYSTRAH